MVGLKKEVNQKANYVKIQLGES